MDYLTLIKQLQVGVKNYHYRLGEEIEEHQDEIASEKDKEMVEDPEVVIASKGDEEIEYREKTAGKVVNVTEEDPEVIASEGDEEIQERPKKIAPKMTKKARARHARMLSVILLRKFPLIILLTTHTLSLQAALWSDSWSTCWCHVDVTVCILNLRLSISLILSVYVFAAKIVMMLAYTALIRLEYRVVRC